MIEAPVVRAGLFSKKTLDLKAIEKQIRLTEEQIETFSKEIASA